MGDAPAHRCMRPVSLCGNRVPAVLSASSQADTPILDSVVTSIIHWLKDVILVPRRRNLNGGAACFVKQVRRHRVPDRVRDRERDEELADHRFPPSLDRQAVETPVRDLELWRKVSRKTESALSRRNTRSGRWSETGSQRVRAVCHFKELSFEITLQVLLLVRIGSAGGVRAP